MRHLNISISNITSIIRITSILGVTVLCLAGCRTGFKGSPNNNTNTDTKPPACAKKTTGATWLKANERVFNLLAGLTCESAKSSGVLMGQSAGNGDAIATTGGQNSYEKLVTAVKTASSNTPMVVSIEYAGDKEYTKDDLLKANASLKKHWDEGGLVSVSWMPLNPFNSRDEVNLAVLLDTLSPAYVKWRQSLDIVAEALADLEEKGVPVLFRPLPEMNTDTYWWGTHSQPAGDKAVHFAALWKDTYDYLVTSRRLDNLIWVYSPYDYDAANSKHKKINWAYPGKSYVDIVAGITRKDTLQISSYSEMVALEHPLGMAEYRPLPVEQGGKLGVQKNDFDARIVGDRLNGSYPAVSYWVSWHNYSYQNGNGVDSNTNLALVDMSDLKTLATRKNILSLEKVKTDKLMP